MPRSNIPCPALRTPAVGYSFSGLTRSRSISTRATSPKATERHPSRIPGRLQSFSESLLGFSKLLLRLCELGEGGRHINCFCRSSGDVAGDIQIPAVLLDLGVLDQANWDPAVTIDGFSAAVGGDDGTDALNAQMVLVLTLSELRRSVHEQHCALLWLRLGRTKDQEACRDTRRVEQVRRQADHGLKQVGLHQALSDLPLGATPEQNAVRHDHPNPTRIRRH